MCATKYPKSERGAETTIRVTYAVRISIKSLFGSVVTVTDNSGILGAMPVWSNLQ